MLVMHVISNLGTGGAETSLFQLVKNNSDDRQIVVSMRDLGVYGDQLLALGVQVYTLDMRPGSLSFSGLSKLFRLIRSYRPDVIQTWMYHADLIGGLIARLALCNRVCWGIHHSNLDANANSKALLLVVKCCAIVSWFVPKKIISCSERSMQVHISAKYRGRIFTVVPNGYDLDNFNFDENARSGFRKSVQATSEILLGMVGRWHPQKDHKNLIDAIAIINDQEMGFVRCVLVGEDMDENNAELVSALKQSGVRKNFMLLGKRNDVPAVMSGIDIHVLSSRGEAFPNVVAEAMACKTPCVVTDVGDAAIIVGSTGWVVNPESSESLAAGIAQALSDAEQSKEWEQRRESCRERILRNYEIGKVVQRYREVWLELAR